MARNLRFQCDGECNEVGFGVACVNARFVFDHDIIVHQDEWLEVIDGQWFHCRADGTKTQIEGKWDR